jgi:hypothetical protein
VRENLSVCRFRGVLRYNSRHEKAPEAGLEFSERAKVRVLEFSIDLDNCPVVLNPGVADFT